MANIPDSSSFSAGQDEKEIVLQNLRDAIKTLNVDALLSPSYDDTTSSRNKEKHLLGLITKLLKLDLTDQEKRQLLACWLTFVGLTQQNIRHLEICSIIDFHSLMSVSQSELRSLADRGRFTADTKKRLLQSTVILQSQCTPMESVQRQDDYAGPSSSSSTPATVNPIPSLTVGNKLIQSTSMQFGPPKSPKASSRLVHAIPHKWHRSTRFFSGGDSVCRFCQRPLGFSFLNAWEKCRSCKWKVHTQCKSRVGDSCGLTPDHLRFLFDKLIQENNGGMWNDPQSAAPLPGSRSMNEPAFQYPDAAIDSSSSTNSSAPSTPALPLGAGGQIAGSLNPLTAPYRSADRRFLFPDTESHPIFNKLPILVISEGDNNSETKVDAAVESEGTIVAAGDSVGSNDASDSSERFNRSGKEGHTWERHTWNMSTIRGPNTQASWNEVTIQFDNIEFDKHAPVIGHGRFGLVLRGYHYGDVAVKLLNMDHVTDKARRADEFKLEVSAYKNTRHDNIALFLGYFVCDEKFGIVTNLCRGSRSLYNMLHNSRERVDFGTNLSIALQICQGISYLHTKKILHKDLRSRNVLLESKNKVVITDFAFVSMKRLSQPKMKYGYLIPQFWLSYISPEIVCSVRCGIHEDYDDELPFTEASDAYAFGTILFEMLTGKMPWLEDPAHRVMFLKGQGIKAPVPNLKCSRDMKELLLKCWTTDPKSRPTFADIHAKLISLPKKTRIDRSPSFPVMMRSYESTF